MKYLILLIFIMGCQLPDIQAGSIPIPLEILAWVGASLALLKALSAFFTFVAKKTANTWDNKVATAFAKLILFLSWLIDAISGNSKPKADLK